jgi:hypothetical protein
MKDKCLVSEETFVAGALHGVSDLSTAPASVQVAANLLHAHRLGDRAPVRERWTESLRETSEE